MFDKDDFPDDNFDNAVNKAEKKGVKVAYSNESFELWYVLHFYNHKSAHKRDYYTDKLTELLGEKYKKNDRLMYNRLEDKLLTAIKHAKELHKECNGLTHSKSNPCTTVHLLVQRLREIAESQSFS